MRLNDNSSNNARHVKSGKINTDIRETSNRRERENRTELRDTIIEISRLVPDTFHEEESRQRLGKVAVLKVAAGYIKHLQRENKRLLLEMSRLSSLEENSMLELKRTRSSPLFTRESTPAETPSKRRIIKQCEGREDEKVGNRAVILPPLRSIFGGSNQPPSPPNSDIDSVNAGSKIPNKFCPPSLPAFSYNFPSMPLPQPTLEQTAYTLMSLGSRSSSGYFHTPGSSERKQS
ncbi:uncharacterized protein VTP21DRAFT_11052 [Calcarisporiella thermophila]|uniref:uncharacterized protein n=1 Tax=Calcarisporiella thermophila TaxID=911321 RepID=UPI0037432D73